MASPDTSAQAQTPQFTYNEEILHKEQPAGAITLSEEVVNRYLELTGRPRINTSGGERPEPPIDMLNVFFSRGQEVGANVSLEGATVGLNAGRAIELYHPIYVGDTLTRSAVLQDVYAKTGRSGTMAFEVWEILFRNERGELVARARDSMVYRAPGVAPQTPRDGEASA